MALSNRDNSLQKEIQKDVYESTRKENKSSGGEPSDLSCLWRQTAVNFQSAF